MNTYAPVLCLNSCSPFLFYPSPKHSRELRRFLHSCCESHRALGCAQEQSRAAASDGTSGQYVYLLLCHASRKTSVRLISKCLDGAVTIINVIKCPPSSARFTSLSAEMRCHKAPPTRTEGPRRSGRTQPWKQLT